MLKNRRYFSKQILKTNKSVYKWLKKAEADTKTLPNGSEKVCKGEYSVVIRSRNQKRSRGEMANDRQFSSNRAADYGLTPSEKYNYDRNQSQNHQRQSKTNSDNEQQSDSEQQSGSELPDSEGSDEEDDGEEEDGEV